MAEKELKIKVTTETDVKDVDDLEEALQRLQDTNVTVSVDAESTELEEVESRIEELEQKRADIYMGVDDSDLEEVEAELEELEARQIDLTVNVDDSGLDEVSSKMDDVESKSNEATDSINAIGGAMASIGAVAGLDQMITTADNINMSWERLGHTFGGVTDTLKNDVNSAAESTGRAGGLIRDYFNTMGIAGVQNTGLLRDSFESLAGQAVATNGNIESMESSLKRMVMTGNAGDRQLTQLGITSKELGQVMGMTGEEAKKAFKELSAEDRLRVLTQAMGGAKDMNDAYKNSLQGMKDQFNQAMAGLMGAVGQVILPIVIPAMKTLTEIIKTLSNAFKGLPAPLQGIVGGFGAVVLGATAITGALGIAGHAIKGLYDGFQTLRKAVQFIRELELATKAYSAAETIANGVRRVAAMAQAALNLVMSMNPIALVVIAIVALIAILWYLYNTCEPVRNAIDGIWAGVTSAIQPIIDSVQWLIDELTRLANGDWTVTIELVKAGASSGVDTAVDMANNDLSRGIVGALMGDEALTQIDEQMPAFKEKLSTSINEMLDSIWNDGTQGFLGWLAGIAGIDVGSYLTGLQTSLNHIPEWVNQAGQSAIQGFKNMYDGAAQWLNNIINNVMTFGGRLVTSITTAAHNAWKSFVDNVKGMWKHMAEEVDSILSEADRLLRELPGKLWNAAVNMVRGWLTGSGEGSPGFMYYAFEEDLGAMERISRNNNIADNIGDTARSMVTNWGNNSQLEATGSNNSSSGGVPVSYTFNLYGDIDNEERMQRFVDEVRRQIDWNNETAGRSVSL